MSDTKVDVLVDSAMSAISLAHDYCEYFTGQWQETTIQTHIDALQRDLDAKDYNGAFYSLRALEAVLWRLSSEVADDARNELYGSEGEDVAMTDQRHKDVASLVESLMLEPQQEGKNE